MMKQITINIISALLFSGLYAQGPAQKMTLSLQQAMDLAVKSRYDMKADSYNTELAVININKSKQEYLPDISGAGNIRYSPQVQGTFIPAGLLSPEPTTAVFGAKANSVFGIELNQNIYKPGILSDIRIANKELAIEQEKKHLQENKIRDQVAQSYLNILLKDLQVRVLQEDESRYTAYFELAEGKFRLGTLIENDLLKAKLDKENAKIATTVAIQNYQLAQDNFKYIINIPTGSAVILSDSLFSGGLFPEDAAGKIDPASRTEIKQLNLSQEKNAILLEKTIHSTLPSVSFYANYSRQFQYSSFKYGDGRWWSPFSYVGLKITVPITAYLKKGNSIKESRLKAIQTDLLLKQKIADVEYEIQKGKAELTNAGQNMQVTKANYTLSQSIYETQKQQYKIGTLLYTNLLETDRSLKTTEQNYIKAVYDWLVAKLNYYKAVGIL